MQYQQLCLSMLLLFLQLLKGFIILAKLSEIIWHASPGVSDVMLHLLSKFVV